jgi:hypothetical protein
MSDLSWQSVSIITLGFLFVIPALLLKINDWINAYRRYQRRKHRLYVVGSLYGSNRRD